MVVNHSAVYVSTPITSGRRFADWSSGRDWKVDLSHPQTYQEFLREVLEPNNKHARKIIRQLRSLFPKTLIDPTSLNDIEGWTQDDYRVLWGRVIEQYSGSVVFLDGWEYSNGCAYEFLVANQMTPRPSIVKESLEPLTFEEGTQLLKEALNELQRSKLATQFLQEVLNQLTRLHTREEILTEA